MMVLTLATIAEEVARYMFQKTTIFVTVDSPFDANKAFFDLKVNDFKNNEGQAQLTEVFDVYAHSIHSRGHHKRVLTQQH